MSWPDLSVKRARTSRDPLLSPPPSVRARVSWEDRLPSEVVARVALFLFSPEHASFYAKYGSRCPAVPLGPIFDSGWLHPKIACTERSRYGWSLAKRDWRYITRGKTVLITLPNGGQMYPRAILGVYAHALDVDYDGRLSTMSNIASVVLYADVRRG